MTWAVALVLAAAGGFVAYRVASARQAEAYVRAATAARRQLIALAAGRTPAEVDAALPRLPLGRGLLTPRARRQVRRQLWPKLAQLLSREAVKRWRASAGDDKGRAVFALHNGQPWETGWVFPEGQWMPLDQVLEAYRQCLEDAGPLWERGWMPIIFDGGSSYVAHDQSGSGELRIVWFEDDEAEPLACGIAAWLAQLNRQAEQGDLRFDPERGQPILD